MGSARRTLILICLLIIFTGLQVNQGFAEYRVNPYWYRIIGGRPNNDVVVLERILEKLTTIYFSKLSIPVVHGTADKELYEQLNEMFFQGIIHFDQEIENNTNKRLVDLEFLPEQRPYYETNVDFRVNYNAGGLLSITVLFRHYSDRMQEMSFMETVNMDLTTGRAIEFHDLFATEEERNMLIKAINDQIQLNPKIYYVEKIDNSYLEQIQNFFLLDNHIVIYFDANYLSPYSLGIPEFPFKLSTAVFTLKQKNEPGKNE